MIWTKEYRKEYLRKYYQKYKKEYQKRHRKYYQEHKKEFAIYYQEHKEHFLAKKYERVYGITIKDYNRMLKKQNNVCAICKKSIKDNGRRLFVDHDHKTGKIRKLLCYQCNTALGWYERNKKQISKYLKKEL